VIREDDKSEKGKEMNEEKNTERQEKNKEKWIDRVKNSDAMRVGRRIAVMGGVWFLSQASALAHKAPVASDNDRPKDNTESIVHTDIQNTRAPHRAYWGQYYNEFCNGSPCWLASTYETNGAGEQGSKHSNSMASWNDNGNYRGLNQLDPSYSRLFLQWLKDKPEYASVYKALAAGGIGKANWIRVAKEQEHLMTTAFEYYMVGEYSAPKMKKIQEQLDQNHVDVNLHNLHPAVLSCIHKMLVESPGSSIKGIPTKIGDWSRKHGTDIKNFNSPEFIDNLLPSRQQIVARRAKELLKNQCTKGKVTKSVNWNVAQFDVLLSQVRKPKEKVAQQMLNNENQSEMTAELGSDIKKPVWNWKPIGPVELPEKLPIPEMSSNAQSPQLVHQSKKAAKVKKDIALVKFKQQKYSRN
jgi:hypothetical protein